MVSLTPSLNCHKNSSETLLGLLPPQEQVMRLNESRDMQHAFRMWLGQEEYFSPYTTNLGDIDDLVVPEVANLDCPLIVSMPNEGGELDQCLPALPECNFYSNWPNGYGDYLGESGFGVGYYQVFENGEPFNNTTVHATMESWGSQGQLRTPVSRENNGKVARYSAEERRARILRYLKKRNQRNFNKTIKYACRKALADRRVRIHGRFAKNHEDDAPLTNNGATSLEDNLAVPFNMNNVDKNEEYYDEEWLQAPVSDGELDVHPMYPWLAWPICS